MKILIVEGSVEDCAAFARLLSLHMSSIESCNVKVKEMKPAAPASQLPSKQELILSDKDKVVLDRAMDKVHKGEQLSLIESEPPNIKGRPNKGSAGWVMMDMLSRQKKATHSQILDYVMVVRPDLNRVSTYSNLYDYAKRYGVKRHTDGFWYHPDTEVPA